MFFYNIVLFHVISCNSKQNNLMLTNSMLCIIKIKGIKSRDKKFKITAEICNVGPITEFSSTIKSSYSLESDEYFVFVDAFHVDHYLHILNINLIYLSRLLKEAAEKIEILRHSRIKL